MFTIDMLPANEGDALWVEYGAGDGPIRRILIDCGRKTAYRAVAERLGDRPDLDFGWASRYGFCTSPAASATSGSTAGAI